MFLNTDVVQMKHSNDQWMNTLILSYGIKYLLMYSLNLYRNVEVWHMSQQQSVITKAKFLLAM